MSFSGQRAARAYDNIIPPHQLVQEEGADTLLLELPGFTKEQIRVQINNYGKLRISGQRPLSDNKWSRFRKDYIVSEDFNVRDIRAKFENNILSVVMPKLTTREIAKDREPTNSDAKVANDLPKPNAPPTDAINERENKEEKEKEPSKKYSKDKSGTDEKAPAPAAKEETLAAAEAAASDGSNRKIDRRSGLRLCSPTKLVLKLVIPILFFVGMGLFLTYKLRRPADTESLDVTNLFDI